MKTDDLIAALAQTVEPAPAGPVAARRFALPLAAGLICAFALVGLWLGFAPWRQASASAGFWLKLTYAAALGLIGLVLAARLAMPSGRAGRILPIAVAALVAAILVTGARQMLAAPDEMRMTVMMGASWSRCPLYILAVAAPVYAAGIVAMRGLAPTRPAVAGAAAGLLAGGAGAAVYALHCPEYAPAFIAVWYTAGIALSTILGAAAGSRLLRW